MSMLAIAFAFGFTTCAVLCWFAYREPKRPPAQHPPVCRYCGCAWPLPPDEREHRPERDPGLRS